MFTEFENQVFKICYERLSWRERINLNIGLNALLRELEQFNNDVDIALDIKQKISSL